MDPSEGQGLEARIRAASEAGDRKAAATALLEGYGHELLGFLIAHLRDRDAATEVFSQFTEDLWRGLDGFRWQCTARVWSYTLARNAATRYLKDARRRNGRHVPLSRAGSLSGIEQKIRTETIAALRTETRTRLEKLRDGLRPEEQTLLVLRVNRKLNWNEIAQVLLHEGEVVASDQLRKEAVRLRQRYQVIKEKLRRLAAEQGIVAMDEGE
jgi:RNA polymerase sigma-70 factor (ECF subfamily)